MTEEDISEEEIEQLAEQLQSEGGNDGYGYPKPPEKENIFKFFRHILAKIPPHKVTNPREEEISQMKNYLNIANFADNVGLDDVGKYIRSKSNTIAETAMSRKGFLAQLFVTQIKKEQKLAPSKAIKKTWTGKDKEVSQ